MTVLVELAGLCHFRKPRASALSLMIFPLVDSIKTLKFSLPDLPNHYYQKCKFLHFW
jgi:hypothetical protein